jgi:hypothetical protein
MYQFSSRELLSKRESNWQGYQGYSIGSSESNENSRSSESTENSRSSESIENSRSSESTGNSRSSDVQEIPQSKFERKLDSIIESIESIKSYQKRTEEKLSEILQYCDVMKKCLTKSIDHVPIFIKKSYTGIDNETNIIDGKLSIIVNVITKFTEDPKIYPFGFTNIKEIYKEQIVNLVILDSNDIPFGDGSGFLRKNHQDLYVIDGLKFKIGETDCQIEEINLPFAISCKIDI